MKITYLGHACILIETKDKTILIDPFITGNPLAKHIKIENLKPDYILITHAHEDHILDVETIAKNSGALLVSNFEIINYYQAKGFKGHSMNIGGSWKFDFGRVFCTTAVHSSSFPDGTYGGVPCGFIIETSHHRVYVAGDTALTHDMRIIPKVFGRIDMAVLPIGDNFTMGINAAAVAAGFLLCDHVLGYHYDTFDAIKLDKEKAMKRFEQMDKDLYLLPIGDCLKI